MHISKCTFEEFGQNCFKILPFCLNTKFLWLQKFKTKNPLKSIFTEYLYSLFQCDQKNDFHFRDQEIQVICSRTYCQCSVSATTQSIAFLGGWSVIHGCQKRDILVEEMKDDPLTWLQGEKIVPTPISEATVCLRVSLDEWPCLISVAGLLKFIENHSNGNTVTDSVLWFRSQTQVSASLMICYQSAV